MRFDCGIWDDRGTAWARASDRVYAETTGEVTGAGATRLAFDTTRLGAWASGDRCAVIVVAAGFDGCTGDDGRELGLPFLLLGPAASVAGNALLGAACANDTGGCWRGCATGPGSTLAAGFSAVTFVSGTTGTDSTGASAFPGETDSAAGLVCAADAPVGAVATCVGAVVCGTSSGSAFDATVGDGVGAACGRISSAQACVRSRTVRATSGNNMGPATATSANAIITAATSGARDTATDRGLA